MERNVKIIDTEWKDGKSGQKYLRVKTDDGWMSCFSASLNQDIIRNVGNVMRLIVDENESVGSDGETRVFKNIRGIAETVSVEDDGSVVSKKQVVIDPKEFGMEVKVADKNATIYVSYAKDIFIALLEKDKSSLGAETLMELAIRLVNQAKNEF